MATPSNPRELRDDVNLTRRISYHRQIERTVNSYAIPAMRTRKFSDYSDKTQSFAYNYLFTSAFVIVTLYIRLAHRSLLVTLHLMRRLIMSLRVYIYCNERVHSRSIASMHTNQRL